MDPIAMELAVLADFLLAKAAESPQRRAAQKIDLDHEQLRVTAIGFAEGGELPEHKNPGEAVLQVVRGRIRLTDATRSIDVGEGTLARIPNGVHSVTALEPSVIVLTAISLPDRP
ncbi:LuxR family transcriptional regulator [Microcella sp.]|uniref:LuxR family transcriptional regulator n=1 Tax=Microcella sp. TaxID=1913979 RepID=UPI002565673D|nr:LuxR family transcriptional regulator [Microcella sp.]MBX9471984.1 LuxR family transcriptional regulator [Microcella sp.]